jgi:hypothetical protein
MAASNVGVTGVERHELRNTTAAAARVRTHHPAADPDSHGVMRATLGGRITTA